MNPRMLLASVGTGLALAVGACGDDEDDESASTAPATTEAQEQPADGAAQTIKLSETEFKITPASVEIAEAGSVEFEVRNDGQTTHALEVERGEEEHETSIIAAGESVTLRVELEDGTYELYCPIGDHEDRGMKATLTVGAAAAPDDSGGEGSEDPKGDDSGGAAAPDDSDNSGGAAAPDDRGY